MSPATAWPLAKRLADMERQVETAARENRLLKLKPGYLAGTFGVTKDEVRAAINKHSELGGGGK